MYSYGYKEIGLAGQIVVCEASRYSTSIHEVIDSRFGSLSGLPPVNAHLHLLNKSRDEQHAAIIPLPSAMTIRMDEGERSIHGCLLYDSVPQLMSFFESHYVPSSTNSFDEAVRALHTGDRSAYMHLESRLYQIDEGHGGWRYRRRREIKFQDSPACIRLRTARNDMVVKYCDGHPWYLPSSDHQRQAIIWAADSYEIRHHRIPRLRYLLAVDEFEPMSTSRSNGAAYRYLFFGHNGYRWLGDADDLTDAESEVMERDGQLSPDVSFDPWPAVHLRARALVRIPGRDELTAACTLSRRQPKPRTAVLRNPAIVRDSRQPVMLHRQLPCIDDPRAAAYLLQHLTNGIYLPDEPAVELEPSAVSDESWLVLCDPAATH